MIALFIGGPRHREVAHVDYDMRRLEVWDNPDRIEGRYVREKFGYRNQPIYAFVWQSLDGPATIDPAQQVAAAIDDARQLTELVAPTKGSSP